MYVYGVWMNLREFWSVQALYVATNALYWKFFKRQISTHLILLKHQNTKTFLYMLSKNHWVITLLEILGSDYQKFTIYSLFGSPCKSRDCDDTDDKDNGDDDDL